VYCKDARAKLIRYVKEVEWTPEPRWDSKTEAEKIERLCSDGGLSEADRRNIGKVLLKTSGTFA
jgi:hypothetical protein